MRTPEELLCSRGWRIRHSAWMLWGILSLGLLWVVGFAIIGFKARNRAWLLITAGWLAYTIAVFTITGVADTPEKGEPSTPLSSVMGWVYILGWFGGAVLAWFVNRRWLVWRAHHSNRRPWYATTATPADADHLEGPASTAVVDAAFGSMPSAHGAAAPRPGAASGPEPISPSPQMARPGPAGPYAAGASQLSTPLDVNTATRDELAALPGLDAAWADYIIAARDRVGGFGDPSELVTAASVPPHVFAGLRNLLATGRTGASAPSASTQSGRPDGRRLEF